MVNLTYIGITFLFKLHLHLLVCFLMFNSCVIFDTSFLFFNKLKTPFFKREPVINLSCVYLKRLINRLDIYPFDHMIQIKNMPQPIYLYLESRYIDNSSYTLAVQKGQTPVKCQRLGYNGSPLLCIYIDLRYR